MGVSPFRFGWLLRLAASRAAVFGEQLRIVLRQEEMVALLTASPQAARILRPVCRMLAVEASILRTQDARLAGSPAAVDAGDRSEATPPKRVRKSRAAVDFGRIPLPRGGLAAARRQGYGKRF